MGRMDHPGAEMRRAQGVTALSLLVGYAGYYVCRSNSSVAAPLQIEEFGAQGLDKEVLGEIASLGVLCHAFGKLVTGVACDFGGGRPMFLLGLFGSVAATLAFGFGAGAGTFLLAWAANRLVQSMGWGALVKIASNRWSYRSHGRVLALLSLSFLFGDALARYGLGTLIDAGFGWDGVFFAAASVLLSIGVVLAFTIRTSPTDLGLAEPEVHPGNLHGQRGGAEGRPASLGALLGPCLRSGAFWLVASLSLGLTLIREAFNFWTPTDLVEGGGLSAGDAARASLLYPLFGGLSVLLTTWLSDRLSAGRRGGVMLAALVPLVGVLAAMGTPRTVDGPAVPLALGGRTGSSTTAGLVDGAGYLGGTLSGWGVGRLAQGQGWNVVFLALAGIALYTVFVAFACWRGREVGHGGPPR